MNALKHGLASQQLVIDGEDPAVLVALRAELTAEHQPVGQTEAMLVEDLIVCWWRLQRARRHETNAVKGTFAGHPFDLSVMDRLSATPRQPNGGWSLALAHLRTAQNYRGKRIHNPAETAPSPQPQQGEKVIAIGSIPQNEPAESERTPSPEPPTELTTENRQLTTKIGSVPQNGTETPEPYPGPTSQVPSAALSNNRQPLTTAVGSVPPNRHEPHRHTELSTRVIGI